MSDRRLDVGRARSARTRPRCGVEAAHVQGEAAVSRREIEARVLGGQGEFAERLLLRQDVAEGDALVVGPEDEVDAPARRLLLPQRDDELVVAVGDRPLGPNAFSQVESFDRFSGADDLEIAVERPARR